MTVQQSAPGLPSLGGRVSLWPTKVPVRVAFIVVTVGAAYHYSLSTLLRDWRYQTPLADLALVPLLGVGLLIVASRRHRLVGASRLGRLDLVVAGLCMVVVVAVMVVGPILLANYYWAIRPDLLSLPLLALAAIAILFGTRAIVAFMFPLAFLLLAWPLPHTMLLEQVLDGITTVTSAAVAAVVRALPVAAVVPGGEDLRLLVPHNGGEFLVSVASACSGTESLVGFGVVALATQYLIQGPLQRRLGWLAIGALAVWLGNLIRILAILCTGRRFGSQMALEVLHPVAGIIMLNLIFAGLLLMVRRLGLSWRLARTDEAASDTPLAQPAPPEQRATGGKVTARLLILTIGAGSLALVNGQLANAATGFSNSDRPASTTFMGHPTVGPLWKATKLRELDWSRPYFGKNSHWIRYRLRPTRKASAYGQATMWADAIVTHDLGALVAHPVRTCYELHRFVVLADQRVTMAGGIVGRQLVYQIPSGGQWHVLMWEWPVRSGIGDIVHERMILLASTDAQMISPVQKPRRGTRVGESVLAALNSLAPSRDPNPSLSRIMLAAADQIITVRLAGQALRPPAAANMR